MGPDRRLAEGCAAAAASGCKIDFVGVEARLEGVCLCPMELDEEAWNHCQPVDVPREGD